MSASEDSAVAVADVEVPVRQRRPAKPKEDQQRKKQPRYHVILWDDDDHTYDYVQKMLMELFAHEAEKAFLLAKEVDTTGRVIVLTTTREHAELKRDQIHAYGKDPHISRCKGSMYATIEPAPES